MKKHELDITRVLTISTGHITKETAEHLSDHNWNVGLSVYDKAEYGWWIRLPDYYLEDTMEGVKENYPNVPDDLHDCILLALENNCRWLCLDCDAMEVDSLRSYEW